MALHLVFMGVSGTGKSAVGRPVAERLGLEFAEGDDFHPQANIDKMRGGTPLTDEDRWPWLESLASVDPRARPRPAGPPGSPARRCAGPTATCCAEDLPETVFVHLVGDKELILGRMRSRDHFMPPELLDSQLATLELLEPEEHGLVVDIGDPLEEIVANVVRRFADRV